METRVLIVDLNHMAHLYYHSNHQLSVTVNIGGVTREKITTIQSNCLKSIVRWSKYGRLPTAICFDRPVPSRRAYWNSKFSDMSGEKAYKGNREKMPDVMFEGVSDCEQLLRQAGASCYAAYNYEADDLIFACVQRAKVKYPGCPIDIVTNDADLLPLVDETVSVFLRSKTGTYAVSKDLEKVHYVQVTPDNFQEVVERLSAYKGFMIPYNTLLLHKLVRGDSSDQFQRKEISRMFPPTKYNILIQRMLEDNVPVDKIFRYGASSYNVIYRDTKLPYQGTVQDALNDPNKANLILKIAPPEQLLQIIEVLRKYTNLTEEQLATISYVYRGMNLNQDYPSKNPQESRRAFVISEDDDIRNFDEIELQKACSPLQIVLPK